MSCIWVLIPGFRINLGGSQKFYVCVVFLHMVVKVLEGEKCGQDDCQPVTREEFLSVYMSDCEKWKNVNVLTIVIKLWI